MSRDLFYGLDEGAIDAPTLAGRLVQTAIQLCQTCSKEWWEHTPEQRDSITGGFPAFVAVAIVEGSKGTAWESRPVMLATITKAAVRIAANVGPEPRP